MAKFVVIRLEMGEPEIHGPFETEQKALRWRMKQDPYGRSMRYFVRELKSTKG